MLINATNKCWSLVMTGLADVDGFKICIQVCVWMGFPPLIYYIWKAYTWSHQYVTTFLKIDILVHKFKVSKVHFILLVINLFPLWTEDLLRICYCTSIFRKEPASCMLSYKRKQMYNCTATINVYTGEFLHLHFKDGSRITEGTRVSLTLQISSGYDDVKDT